MKCVCGNYIYNILYIQQQSEFVVAVLFLYFIFLSEKGDLCQRQGTTVCFKTQNPEKK